MKVYAIGKIAKNDWRSDIHPTASWDAGDYYSDPPTFEEWPEIDMPGAGVTYVGPYFLSDDHGCYHDTNAHGVAAGARACGAAYPGMHRRDVHSRCLKAIDRATHVFAWIDDPTAYGSLVEIGYALAKGKSLHVYFDAGKREELLHLWFAAHSATQFGWAGDAKHAWDQFVYGDSDEWMI